MILDFRLRCRKATLPPTACAGSAAQGVALMPEARVVVWRHSITTHCLHAHAQRTTVIRALLCLTQCQMDWKKDCLPSACDLSVKGGVHAATAKAE